MHLRLPYNHGVMQLEIVFALVVVQEQGGQFGGSLFYLLGAIAGLYGSDECGGDAC